MHINNPNGRYKALLKKIYTIIKQKYDGDRERSDEIIDLAKSFRTMIVKKKINRKVIDFVDVRRELDADTYYDRDLLQNGYRAI